MNARFQTVELFTWWQYLRAESEILGSRAGCVPSRCVPPLEMAVPVAPETAIRCGLPRLSNRRRRASREPGHVAQPRALLGHPSALHHLLRGQRRGSFGPLPSRPGSVLTQLDALAGRGNLMGPRGPASTGGRILPRGCPRWYWGRLPTGHAPCRGCIVPANPYLATCWMVQRLSSKRLASSRWLTPFECSTRMCSRCCSLRLGRRLGKRPAARAFGYKFANKRGCSLRCTLRRAVSGRGYLPKRAGISRVRRCGPGPSSVRRRTSLSFFRPACGLSLRSISPSLRCRPR